MAQPISQLAAILAYVKVIEGVLQAISRMANVDVDDSQAMEDVEVTRTTLEARWAGLAPPEEAERPPAPPTRLADPPGATVGGGTQDGTRPETEEGPQNQVGPFAAGKSVPLRDVPVDDGVQDGTRKETKEGPLTPYRNVNSN